MVSNIWTRTLRIPDVQSYAVDYFPMKSFGLRMRAYHEYPPIPDTKQDSNNPNSADLECRVGSNQSVAACTEVLLDPMAVYLSQQMLRLLQFHSI